MTRILYSLFVLVFAAVIAHAATEPNLELHLAFDDDLADFVATDSSGNGQNATCSSAECPSVTTGKIAGGYSFDGSSDFLSVPHSSLLDISSAMTLSAWVNPQGTKGTVLAKRNPAGNKSQYILNIDDSKVLCFGFDASGSIHGLRLKFSSGAIPLNSWTHLTCTFDGSEWKIFFNGVLDRSITDPTTLAGPAEPLEIGKRLNSSFFNGAMDDVRVYSRALSDQEVLDLFNGSSTPPPPPPPECSNDSDCDDGLFCNGAETCNASGQCVSGSAACTVGETCNEATDTCELLCGNGNIDPGEDCDSGNLGSNSCISLGFDGGSLSCTSACTFDTSACTTSTSSVRYWVGGSGNWSDTTHWSLTSGGSGGESIPSLGTNVFINAASGSGTVTINQLAQARDVTVSASGINININGNTLECSRDCLFLAGGIDQGTSNAGILKVGRNLDTADINMKVGGHEGNMSIHMVGTGFWRYRIRNAGGSISSSQPKVWNLLAAQHAQTTTLRPVGPMAPLGVDIDVENQLILGDATSRLITDSQEVIGQTVVTIEIHSVVDKMDIVSAGTEIQINNLEHEISGGVGKLQYNINLVNLEKYDITGSFGGAAGSGPTWMLEGPINMGSNTNLSIEKTSAFDTNGHYLQVGAMLIGGSGLGTGEIHLNGGLADVTKNVNLGASSEKPGRIYLEGGQINASELFIKAPGLMKGDGIFEANGSASLGTNYYVSPTGNDVNDGLSPGTALKSFSEGVKKLGPNINVLFKRGGTWSLVGDVTISATGGEIGAYGVGSVPVIKMTSGATVNFGGSGWKIKELRMEIGATAVGCSSNADCDDGLFCNGVETCNTSGQCVSGSAACAVGETCDETLDVCEIPQCTFTRAYWQASGFEIVGAEQFTMVELVLEGTDCEGKSVDFTIREDDFLIDDQPQAQPLSPVLFSGGIAKTTWIAEYVPDGVGGPEWYFDASLVSDPSVTLRSGLLSVTQAATAVCGNGVVEAAEECDGSDLNGQSCTTQGFGSGTLVCNSDCTFDVSQCNTIACGQTVRIMPLGDSITRGGTICDTEGCYRSFLYYDLVSAGYDVDFVGSQLFGENLAPPFDADHEGWPARTTGFFTSRLTGPDATFLIDNPPDVILYHIGTNDVLNGQSVDSAIANVNDALGDIFTFDSTIQVVLAKIILTTKPSDNAWIQNFNSLLPGVVSSWQSSGYSISLVDMENALDPSIDLLSDGVHPSLQGYQKMSNVWYNELVNNVLPSACGPAPSCSSDAECDDGLFCNGVELCDPGIGCLSGTPVSCRVGETCNESTDICTVSSLPAGLVAHWSFEGDAADVSGNGNDGSLQGSPTFTAGLDGSAIELNGGGDFVTVTDSSSLNLTSALTFSAWVNPQGTKGTILSKRNPAGNKNQYLFTLDSSKVLCFGYAADGTPHGLRLKFSSSAIALNSWTHLTCTFDGSEWKIYFNGQLDRSIVDPVVLTGPAEPLEIGRRLTSSYFNGVIDDIQIYDRALSQQEVLDLYNNF